MKATQQLHELGQSLWLDNITRKLLTSGTLKRYVDELSVTGLTSNPTIFDHAIKGGSDYDDVDPPLDGRGQVRRGAVLRAGARGPDAGRRSLPPHPRSHRPASTAGSRSRSRRSSPTTRRAPSGRRRRSTHQAGRPNLYIKIPGTPEGLPAIEDCIFAGVSINVTLLFSRDQYIAAAEAYLRGVERRIEAGLRPDVCSVASVFVSRWDKAVTGKVPDDLRGQLGIAIAKRPTARTASCSTRRAGSGWQNAGARPQRLLWASTGTKDPQASDVLYIEALAAPMTVNTMPEETLHAFADHGSVRPAHVPRRRRRRADARAVREGRRRSRCPRRAAPEGGRRRVRAVVERPAVRDRDQEREPAQGGMIS